MALTRAIAETILLNRLGPLLTVAEMEMAADYNDPLAWATRGVGGSTADHSTVTDAELALVAVADYDDLMMLAEYRTLLNILGALNAVDVTAGPRSEKLHQFVEQVQGMLATLKGAVAELVTPMTAGYISLDLAEHYEDRL